MFGITETFSLISQLLLSAYNCQSIVRDEIASRVCSLPVGIMSLMGSEHLGS